MSERSAPRTWCYVYAMLTGALGLGALALMSSEGDRPVELPAILIFTLITLIVSYFRIPVYQIESPERQPHPACIASLWSVDVSMEDVILLGATLADGPSFGGWIAFITGLMSPVMPTFPPNARARCFLDSTAFSMLGGGRNVLSVVLAWLAYRGVGGVYAPSSIDTSLTLAVIVFCVVYALTHSLWAWPALVLAGTPPGASIEQLLAPGRLLIKLLPLPISLLVSATFTRLGWSFLLLLSLAFISLGAVMRQMAETIHRLRANLTQLMFARTIQEAVAAAPRDMAALCDLAYDLCTDAVSLSRFQIGLYNYVMGHVHIQVATEGDTRLPPMNLPITPLWQWLSEQQAPMLTDDASELDAPPRQAYPPGTGEQSGTTLFIPLLGTQDPTIPDNEPFGGLILQSAEPGAISPPKAACLVEVAAQVAQAIQAAMSDTQQSS